MIKTVQNKLRAVARAAGKQIRKHRFITTGVSSLLCLALLMSVLTVTIHEVRVYDDQRAIASFYTVTADSETLLKKAGVTLNAADGLERTEERGAITLSITRAFPVSVTADGETRQLLVTGGTVAAFLELAGVRLGETDTVSQELDEAVTAGMQIRVDRVKTVTEVVTETVDYETRKVYTDELYEGQTEVEQEGKDGERELTYAVTTVNGEETERELVKNEITVEPVEEILRVGTKVRSSFKKTSSTPANYRKVIAMNATAYAAGGTTATGRPAVWGVVAVDPSVIPLGTTVYVESADGYYIYGTAVAADTGGAIKGNRIDICVNTEAEAERFGRRVVNVYILD